MGIPTGIKYYLYIRNLDLKRFILYKFRSFTLMKSCNKINVMLQF
ncbi:hypothetical protein CLL_A3054 [Clostridium botulinum B str. Eklund 17B (NRP)]|uniref:Uncharacterized protein n=1 Tax=Clostridium botulinum (strain Eklund 17B / Type B) TaxID=935198 RepID=B2TPW3_CLOBB|nr:hypothetical protein CLL_A3054 [Clostridium botulinum B str. Eklund 17B (NRP)]